MPHLWQAETEDWGPWERIHRQGGFVARLLPDAPEARHKLTVSCGQMTYAYDLAADGTPLVVPANMGNEHYSADVMRCIHDNDYVPVLSMEPDVSLPSEFTPFLCPNVFCDYAEGDAYVAGAREMATSCENQGEFAERACEFVMETVEYNHGKAESVGKGYAPSPMPPSPKARASASTTPLSSPRRSDPSASPQKS